MRQLPFFCGEGRQSGPCADLCGQTVGLGLNGPVDFRVVGVEVLHQDLVRPRPLAQPVVGCVIAWHVCFLLDVIECASLFCGGGFPLYKTQKNAPKWDVCIHLMEIKGQCAYLLPVAGRKQRKGLLFRGRNRIINSAIQPIPGKHSVKKIRNSEQIGCRKGAKTA